MKTIKWYSPGGDEEQGGTRATDQESVLRQEGPHEPGDTPLADQEELPGGYIHGHAEPDENDE